MHKAPAPSTSRSLRSIEIRRGHASLLVLAGAVGALFGPGACGSDIANTASTGNATTGQPAGTGGMGGMSGGEGGEQSAGGMGGMGGTGGTGGGVGPGCKQDCENEPKNKVCDTMTGDCVECLPSEDPCAQGQYCEVSYTCTVGCNEQSDCMGDTACDLSSHTCMGCDIDTECAPGTICINTICVPGCSNFQPCQVGYSCCGQTCYNFENDVDHCGGCNNQCKPPPHTTPVCVSSTCTGVCIAPWEDCNLSDSDGCEHNTLQDGPCP